MTSANDAKVFPEPTGPSKPLTKLSSFKKSHVVGLSLKSKLRPDSASVVAFLVLRLDLSVALGALAIR